MKKRSFGYDEKAIREVLEEKVEIPNSVEQKMQQAYREIGVEKTNGIQYRKRRRWTAVAAVAILAMTASVGIYAVNHYYTKKVTENGRKLSYEFQMNYDATPYDIEVTANYIPKGYELKTEGPYEGKIHNDETGKGITVMPFNAANLDDMKTRDFSNVLNVEKMEIQNMEAHVITYEKMGETLQDILLFNEADGYCVDIWSNAEKLMGEELKKVAENLQIKKLDTQIAYKTAQEKVREEKWKHAEETRRSKSIPKELIRNIGVEMTDPNFENLDYVEDIRYTVEDVQILDAISFEEFPKENFDTTTIEQIDTFEEEVKPWLNEDGTLKQHARYLTGEDGVNDSKENREMIGAKFVVVHMKANVAGGAKDSMEETDISVTLAPDMEFYETDENGDLTHAKEYSTPDKFAGNAGYPIYFETSSELEYDPKVKSVWHCKLDKGDVVEYTLIYIVDEDRLENAYLQFYMNGNFMEYGCTYVKITEKS